jgi:hypothetical protein
LLSSLGLYSAPQTKFPTATQRLKTESGLDTLERRLLAEADTRKLGANGKESKQKGPDIRSLNLRKRRMSTELYALRIDEGASSIKSLISSAKEMIVLPYFRSTRSWVGDVDLFSRMWR